MGRKKGGDSRTVNLAHTKAKLFCMCPTICNPVFVSQLELQSFLALEVNDAELYPTILLDNTAAFQKLRIWKT